MTATPDSTESTVVYSAKTTPYKTLIDDIKAIDRLKLAIQSALSEQGKYQDAVDRNGYSAFVQGNESKERKCRADKAHGDLLKANSTLATLEQELANSKPYISIDLVIEHQAAIGTVQAEIDNYQKLIEAQQQIIAIASQQPDLTSELIAEREELLTDIVLGGNKASALKKVDEQLEAIETVTLASNSKIIEQANQTIIGLNRRVESTQEKLSFLESFTPKMLDILLMKQAEQVSIEFNAIASTLIEKLKQLVALESLITKIGQRKDTDLLYESWRLKIPCVGYEKIPATLHIETHYIIDGNQTAFKSESMDTVNQLRQHLLNQGIELNQIGG